MITSDQVLCGAGEVGVRISQNESVRNVVASGMGCYGRGLYCDAGNTELKAPHPKFNVEVQKFNMHNILFEHPGPTYS